MSSFEEGLKLFKEKKYEEAAEKFLHITEHDPDNSKAWNALGVVLSKMGDHAQALAAFENALRLDPTNTIYQKNRDKAAGRKIPLQSTTPLPQRDTKPKIPLFSSILWWHWVSGAAVLLVIIILIFVAISGPTDFGS